MYQRDLLISVQQEEALIGVRYAQRPSWQWRNVSTTVIKFLKVPTVGTRLEENKDVKENFTMRFVADRINIRIFLLPMIYNTVSARFMAQLNMSFMQYLLFWNCRYIASYWKPSISRLWHKLRWERGFDPTECWYFPHASVSCPSEDYTLACLAEETHLHNLTFPTHE